MTADELNTSTNEDRGIEPENDPWSDVMGRLGGESNWKKEPRGEPVPRRTIESGRAEQGGVGSPAPGKQASQHTRVRVTVMAALCALAVGLLWISLPMMGTSDRMTSSPQGASRTRDRPALHRTRDRQGASTQRTGRGRAKAKVRAGKRRNRHRGHGESVEAELASAPTGPEPQGGSPSVPESTRVPMEPVPPPVQEPHGEGDGLIDGSRDSAEFGL